jgi:hypothetical protein
VAAYRGCKDAVRRLDFIRADARIMRFNDAGFKMDVLSYCGFPGLDTCRNSSEPSPAVQKQAATGAAGARDRRCLHAVAASVFLGKSV